MLSTSSSLAAFTNKNKKATSSLERSTSTSSQQQSTIMNNTINLLAKAWAPRVMKLEHADGNDDKKSRVACQAAIQRTLPLFLQIKDNEPYYDNTAASSVPFVCRYRTDVIHPLTTQQVHLLRAMVGQHEDLRSLRAKLLPHFPLSDIEDDATTTIRAKIMTSTSKTELEDLYAPFKPPPKGSILERIQSQHPKLVDSIETLWKDKSCSKASLTAVVQNWSKLGPREAVVQVLGSKLAAEPQLTWWIMEELRKYCRVKTTVVAKTTKPKSGDKKEAKQKSTSKYSEAYGDFSAHTMSLKDHQVLAIRRGVQEKALKMTFEIDSEKMEKHLLWRLRSSNRSSDQTNSNSDGIKSNASELVIPIALLRYRPDSLLKEAVHDAWSRLLRRRGTTRLWTEKCNEAQERACQVFEDNLQRALLAPPHNIPAQPILALDPGFAAGIKCALLDSEGGVLRLDTVKFLGSEATKKAAITKLENMLLEIREKSLEKVTVALGNGHGTADSRKLILEASKNCEVPVDIQLVNEAGASVWSVTKNAQSEFPKYPPAAIAAISIGRRLQNPLFELVKVPPKSLGLGMYQHDLSEKELDEKLHLTSVDAVAAVGVDVNSGSFEILQKVPGLSASLSEKIIKARPLKMRSDLLTISGLGPKSYENCAGFVRISNGLEPLDNTLVHPESYDLARWLLKEFSWKLGASGSDGTIRQNNEDWRIDSKESLAEAARKYNVSEERVLSVVENLMDSMSNEDPRLKLLRGDSTHSSESMASSIGDISTSTGLVKSCKPLPNELSDVNRLFDRITEQGGPIRGITGTIRNIADFGAFVDIGNENNGLLHISKLGPNLQLQSLLIGQQIGVDILSVTLENARISLGLHGCNLQASTPRNTGPRLSTHTKYSSKARSSGNKRSMSTKTSSKNSRGNQKRRRTTK